MNKYFSSTNAGHCFQLFESATSQMVVFQSQTTISMCPRFCNKCRSEWVTSVIWSLCLDVFQFTKTNSNALVLVLQKHLHIRASMYLYVLVILQANLFTHNSDIVHIKKSRKCMFFQDNVIAWTAHRSKLKNKHPEDDNHSKSPLQDLKATDTFFITQKNKMV